MFLGGRLRIHKYDLSRLGLRDAIGGLPLHHPRFIKWIGVPQSAGLIEISSANKLSTNSHGTRLLLRPYIYSAMLD